MSQCCYCGAGLVNKDGEVRTELKQGLVIVNGKYRECSGCAERLFPAKLCYKMDDAEDALRLGALTVWNTKEF